MQEGRAKKREGRDFFEGGGGGGGGARVQLRFINIFSMSVAPVENSQMAL